MYYAFKIFNVIVSSYKISNVTFVLIFLQFIFYSLISISVCINMLIIKTRDKMYCFIFLLCNHLNIIDNCMNLLFFI